MGKIRINKFNYPFRYFHEEVLTSFNDEFKGVKSLKFVKNQPPEGFGRVAEEFGHRISELDHIEKFETLLAQNKITGRFGRRKVNHDGTTMTSSDLLNILIRKWFQNFMKVVDLKIIQKVSEAVKNSSEKRRDIENTVYNFTGKELPAGVLKSLNLGSNFVLHTKMDRSEASKKLSLDLMMYLRKYRTYIEKKRDILEEEPMEWLEKAVEIAEEDGAHHEFYSSVLRSLSIGLGVGKRVNDGVKVDFEQLDQQGICLVEADKNVGICLLNIEDMIRADDELVEELGGEACIDCTAVDIKKGIFEAIEAFEESNGEEAKKFLNRFYGNRLEDYEDSVLPFLKVRPKIHKLSKEQIEAVDTNGLKFRPVVDASRTPLNPYAKMLTEYLRDLMRRTEQKHFVGKSPMIKNGHELAKLFRNKDFKFKERKYFLVADLSSAYTFIYLNNLIVSMNFLGQTNGVPQWKVEMFEKIATLVLSNSFLETTKGIYRLNTCLPMGLCASGECLDVVLLVAELVFLGKVGAGEVPGFMEQYSDYKLQDSTRSRTFFLEYKRYRDDTFSMVKHEEEENPRLNIETLGNVFLPSLDINVQMTIFVGTFLDVLFFKRFSREGYETTVKRKGLYPLTFCHASSNMSSSIVKSIIGGEILRHRRLCSNEVLVKANDECIIMELISRGYKEDFVRNAVAKRIKQISNMYNEDFTLRTSRKENEGLVYGAKSIYDEEWFTHEKLSMILRTSLPEGVK